MYFTYSTNIHQFRCKYEVLVFSITDALLAKAHPLKWTHFVLIFSSPKNKNTDILNRISKTIKSTTLF